MNLINTSDLDPELLEQIDLIVAEQGYANREQAIKAMLTEQASKAVGVVSGDAQLRNMLSFKNCNTKRYGVNYD